MRHQGEGSRCPLCGAEKALGKTTYAVDLGSGVVLVRDVPAMVCQQCGEEWTGAATAQRLEIIVEEARRSNRQVVIVSLDEADAAA